MTLPQINNRSDYDALISKTLSEWSNVPRSCGDTEILTSTGRRIDLLSPKFEDIDPVDIVHSMSTSSRFTGHVSHFFSIAQHSINVCALVSDQAKRAAILHDGIETYIGDDSSPKKRACRILGGEVRSGLDVLKANFDPLIHQRFGIPFPLSDSIKNEIALFDQVAMHYESKALLPEPVCPNPIAGWGPKYCSYVESMLSHDEVPIKQARSEFAAVVATAFPHTAPALSKYLPAPVSAGPGVMAPRSPALTVVKTATSELAPC